MTWFQPEGVELQYVSRRLIVVRLVALALLLLPALVGTSLLAALVAGDTSILWLLPIGVLLLGGFLSYVIVRQVTAHAWAEREDDLVVVRGRLWRRVTVIPYGRMQYVEVQSGPLGRFLGIASVQLHTASPGTDASIAGVPTAEAARLRDRLTERGQARLAGL